MAFMALALGVIVLDTVLTRWAFQQRLLSYVNEQESVILDHLADQLAELHGEHDGWQFARDRRELARTLHRHMRVAGREPLRDLKRDGMSHPTHSVRLLLPRLYLLNASSQVVSGPAAELPESAIDPRRVAIEAEGERLGTLVVLPLESLQQEHDQRFAREHARTLWGIAALALLVASVAGLGLARYLLAPVRDLLRGVRELAAGRYQTRLQVRRHDELGALAQDFNRLAASLQAHVAARQRWLADTAHELRTPLAVLKGELEALEDGIRPLDHQALQSLSAETARLGALIDDLHQLALADAGALAYHFARIDARELLASARERHEARLADIGLTLSMRLPAGPVPIDADAERLTQLLGNLLENCLRYSQRPGEVLLQLAVDDDGWRCLDVSDSGPGVDAEFMPRLFDRFVRAEHSRNRASGGTGLGLAIARHIAEAHGGTLSAAPSASGGLTIRLRLPPVAS